jgi:hypothetical protein
MPDEQTVEVEVEGQGMHWLPKGVTAPSSRPGSLGEE